MFSKLTNSCITFSQTKRLNRAARVRSSTDDSADEAPSQDDPSDLSKNSSRSLRDRTFDGDDGFSDVTESIITQMSTNMSCDLGVLSRADDDEHADEFWSKVRKTHIGV